MTNIAITNITLPITTTYTERLPNETIHGKIIVHDRARVQSEILPIYFNHASFASLRRQLSYFSFVRVGKSRQSGVTYTNDNVIELSDIRKLKRRAVGKVAQAPAAVVKQQKKNNKSSSSSRKLPTQKLALQRKLQAQQQKEQQQQDQLSTTSADVASAVLSGKLHAANTNDRMEKDNNTDTTERARHNTSSGTQSSISQSTTSSTTSNSGNSKRSSSKSSKAKKIKEVKKRKSLSSFPKPSLPRKVRARCDKLLSINNIVPFIHLPAGHRRTQSSSRASSSRKKKEDTAASSTAGSRADSASDVRARVIQSKFLNNVASTTDKPAASTTAAVSASGGGGGGGRERGASCDVAHALLALGEDR